MHIPEAVLGCSPCYSPVTSCYYPRVNGQALCHAQVFKASYFSLVSKPTFFPEAEETARVKGRNMGASEAAGPARGPGTWSTRAEGPWLSACGRELPLYIRFLGL